MTQDDHAFNDVLYKLNNVTDLGSRGFLIDGSKLNFGPWKPHIEGEEDVKALIRQISAEGEEAEKKNIDHSESHSKGHPLAKRGKVEKSLSELV